MPPRSETVKIGAYLISLRWWSFWFLSWPWSDRFFFLCFCVSSKELDAVTLHNQALMNMETNPTSVCNDIPTLVLNANYGMCVLPDTNPPRSQFFDWCRGIYSQTDRLTDKPTDQQADRQADRQTYRQIDKGKQANKQGSRKTGRLTSRRMDGWTERQTKGRQTCIYEPTELPSVLPTY